MHLNTYNTIEISRRGSVFCIIDVNVTMERTTYTTQRRHKFLQFLNNIIAIKLKRKTETGIIIKSNKRMCEHVK